MGEGKNYPHLKGHRIATLMRISKLSLKGLREALKDKSIKDKGWFVDQYELQREKVKKLAINNYGNPIYEEDVE